VREWGTGGGKVCREEIGEAGNKRGINAVDFYFGLSEAPDNFMECWTGRWVGIPAIGEKFDDAFGEECGWLEFRTGALGYGGTKRNKIASGWKWRRKSEKRICNHGVRVDIRGVGIWLLANFAFKSFWSNVWKRGLKGFG